MVCRNGPVCLALAVAASLLAACSPARADETAASGANAMNGVINIITRSAHATTGTYATLGAGNLSTQLEARYGREVGDFVRVEWSLR